MMTDEKPIEYWRELYLEHANTSGYKQRIEKARDAFYEMTQQGLKYQVNVSGGKDSLVLWHMGSQIDEFTAVNYTDQLYQQFECVDRCIKLNAEKFNIECESIVDDFDYWAFFKQHGLETDYRKVLKDRWEQWTDAHQKERGIECLVIGVRAEESYSRRIVEATRGNFYQIKSGKYISKPLSQLSGKDIFAYLFENDMAIPEIYFFTKYQDNQERIRVGWIIPIEGEYHTQHVWVKHYFPDFWQKLCDINPKFRAYV
jgi:3'-phosphoadenosine 5'-phosphosulfate sulfotransferase (PAPS reductase)/FAD synthetase